MQTELINIKEKLVNEAKKDGFADIRFTDANVDPRAFEDLKKFINIGNNGQMLW